MNASTKPYWIRIARKRGLRVHAGMTTARIVAMVTGKPERDRNAGSMVRRLRSVVGSEKFG